MHTLENIFRLPNSRWQKNMVLSSSSLPFLMLHPSVQLGMLDLNGRMNMWQEIRRCKVYFFIRFVWDFLINMRKGFLCVQSINQLTSFDCTKLHWGPHGAIGKLNPYSLPMTCATRLKLLQWTPIDASHTQSSDIDISISGSMVHDINHGSISKLEFLLSLQRNPLVCLLGSVSKITGVFVLPFQLWIQGRLLSNLTEIKISEAYWITQWHMLSCCEGSFGLVMMSMLSNCRNFDTQKKRIALYTLYKHKLRFHHQKQYHLLYKILKYYSFHSEDLMLPPCSPISGICLSDSYKLSYRE